MTYAPADLLAVRAYLLATLDLHPGKVAVDLDPDEVGIVGDDAHAASGGYHIGNSGLAAAGRLSSDYSKRESALDRPGTDAASALDIGDFTKGKVSLRSLSLALVDACRRGDPRAADIREVIYTPDGVRVLRWDRLGIRSTGDSSHLFHTHISFFRTSEGRRAQPNNVLGLLQSLIEGDDDVNAEQDLLLKGDAWRMHTIINDEEKVPANATGDVGGQPNKLRARLVGLEGKVDQLLTAAAADAVRDAAMKVVLDAFAAGGTSMDTAAVIARINEVAAAESATVAELRAEVADLRARLAASAQAAADAYDA